MKNIKVDFFSESKKWPRRIPKIKTITKKTINKIKIIRPWMLPKRYSKYSCVRDPLDLFFLTYSIFTDKELKLLFGFELFGHLEDFYGKSGPFIRVAAHILHLI